MHRRRDSVNAGRRWPVSPVAPSDRESAIPHDMAVNLRFLLAPAVALLALSACSSSSSGGTTAAPVDSRQVFTGSVAATDARVAFVSTGGHTFAYVCGGPTTFTTLSRWFSLVATADGALSATVDGHTLTAKLDGGAFNGTLVTPDGVSHAVDAKAKVAGSQTDLFGVVDEGCRTGAIVEQQGTEEPVVLGTWCSTEKKKTALQVTPAHPVSVVDHTLHVTVAVPGGDKALVLSPVTALE